MNTNLTPTGSAQAGNPRVQETPDAAGVAEGRGVDAERQDEGKTQVARRPPPPCGTCRAFLVVDDMEEPDGECRRRCPQVLPDEPGVYDAVWPVVRADKPGCWDWKPIEAER